MGSRKIIRQTGSAGIAFPMAFSPIASNIAQTVGMYRSTWTKVPCGFLIAPLPPARLESWILGAAQPLAFCPMLVAESSPAHPPRLVPGTREPPDAWL